MQGSKELEDSGAEATRHLGAAPDAGDGGPHDPEASSGVFTRGEPLLNLEANYRAQTISDIVRK